MRSKTTQDASGLTSEVLSDVDDFARISEPLSTLRRSSGAEDDLHTDPVYFLACADRVRRPCSVACFHNNQLLGVLFAYQHYSAGIATGYALSGDYSGRGALVSLPEHRSRVASAAIDCLMRNGIHSLNMRISPALPSLPNLQHLKFQQFHETIPGDRLILAETYEAFLNSLGKHTRRNLRNYTRRADAAGITFDADVSSSDYDAAVQRLSPATRFPLAARRRLRDRRLIDLYGGRRLGLRNVQGQIVATLCGFTRGRRFYMLSQINDARLSHYSLSLVLRGFTIQHLIATSHTELQFMGGTSLTLGRFCHQLDYQAFFIDRRRSIFTPLKMLIASVSAHLARNGRPAPVSMEIFGGSFLIADRLASRTPLMPAAVVKMEALSRMESSADRGTIQH